MLLDKRSLEQAKQLTFSIGMLSIIDTDSDRLQVLMVAPTRELADQIYNVISSLGNSHKDSVCKTNWWRVGSQ